MYYNAHVSIGIFLYMYDLFCAAKALKRLEIFMAEASLTIHKGDKAVLKFSFSTNWKKNTCAINKWILIKFKSILISMEKYFILH